MPAAKFYVMGDINQWLRIRIHEEIQANNLEGSTLDISENKLAVVVEGGIGQIKKAYNGINEGKPENIVLTSLVFGDFKTPKVSISKANVPNELLDVLREIEKKLRRIEQKLDTISAKMSGEIKYGGVDTTSATSSSDGVNPFDAFFNSEP